jgi:surface polysaccharide O-acyltransferase-like enzyme
VPLLAVLVLVPSLAVSVLLQRIPGARRVIA